MRIRRWVHFSGVALLTPALKWVTGRFAEVYHRFIKQPGILNRLTKRRTPVEPLFDLIKVDPIFKVLGTTAKQKQLPVQRIKDVRSCLALATLSIQISMIANSISGMPHRNISEMAAAIQ